MVIKRNGEKAPFQMDKIFSAVEKAFISQHYETEFTERIQRFLKRSIDSLMDNYIEDDVPIETIQDTVEDTLIQYAPPKVAKAYIKHRTKHSIARLEFDPNNLIETYLNGPTGSGTETDQSADMARKENASLSVSLQGMHHYIFSSITENYWTKVLLDEDIKEAHDTGRLHFHDAGILAPYCCGWDLKDFLIKGFSGLDTKVTADPPKHLDSATGQLVNLICTLTGEAAGAQAVSNFNTLLAPFVRNDGLTYEEVKQNIQEFVFNINTPTRVGGQSPFSNVTFDIDVTSTPISEDFVIIGGRLQPTQYKEYQKEAEMIMKAYIQVMLEGDANGAAHSYPIPTFNVTEKFMESDLIPDINELVAKYGTPYFGNFINSDKTESDVTSMCCRYRADHETINAFADEEYEQTHNKAGGYFAAAPKTGSIGVVTLGLPAIMYDAEDQVGMTMDSMSDTSTSTKQIVWRNFLMLIEEYMGIAMQALNTRRRVIEKCINLDGGHSMYPYTRHFLQDIKDRTGQYFSQHFSTIGLNGMNEALRVMGYKEGMLDQEGFDKAEELLSFMEDTTIELQKEYKVLVNLEQTPAESAGVKLCQKSKIDPEGKGFYTNSTWFPAETDMDWFDFAKNQGELNEHYTGGSVVHMYTDQNLSTSKDQLSKVIYRLFKTTKIPYLTIAPRFGVCPSCAKRFPGDQVDDVCPDCGKDLIIYERIVGYYRPTTNWNAGRLTEYERRNRRDIIEEK